MASWRLIIYLVNIILPILPLRATPGSESRGTTAKLVSWSSVDSSPSTSKGASLLKGILSQKRIPVMTDLDVGKVEYPEY